MASEILAKYGTLVTATITLGGLANGAGRICTVIDNSTVRAPMAQIFLKMRTGASSPTSNSAIKLYLIRYSDGATDLSDSGLGLTDAAVTTEPVNAELLDAIIVTSATATDYTKSFRAYDLPKKYSLVVWNSTGQSVDATNGNHILQIVPVTVEAQ